MTLLWQVGVLPPSSIHALYLFLILFVPIWRFRNSVFEHFADGFRMDICLFVNLNKIWKKELYLEKLKNIPEKCWVDIDIGMSCQLVELLVIFWHGFVALRKVFHVCSENFQF